jgi:hypothetical protein
MARTTWAGPIISEGGFAGSSTSTHAVALANVLFNSAALDFPSIAAVSSADLTIAVSGAAVGDCVDLALPAAPTAGLIFQAFVSAADTVTVRAMNITAGAVDAASATYGVTVAKRAAIPAKQP